MPGRVRAAARRQLRGALGPLRRRRLSRRGDPRRDRPLRLRLRGDGARDHARAARHGRAVRVRRAHVRDDGAGARARRRRTSATRAATPPRPCCGWRRCAPSCERALPQPCRLSTSARLPRDGQGMSQLRQGPGVRSEPQPLDGRHQAALRPEPAEGQDPRRQGAAARVRLHALPESRQGHEGPRRAAGLRHTASSSARVLADQSIASDRRSVRHALLRPCLTCPSTLQAVARRILRYRPGGSLEKARFRGR